MYVCTYVVLSLSRKHTYCNSSSNSSALLYSAFSNITSSVLMANGTEDMFYFVCLLLFFLLLLFALRALLTVIVCEQPLKQDTCFTCTHSLSLYSFFLNFRCALFIYFSVFVAVLLLPLLLTFHLVTHTHIYAKSIVDFAHCMCVCMCVSSSSALSAGLLSASSAAFSCFCV